MDLMLGEMQVARLEVFFQSVSSARCSDDHRALLSCPSKEHLLRDGLVFMRNAFNRFDGVAIFDIVCQRVEGRVSLGNNSVVFVVVKESSGVSKGKTWLELDLIGLRLCRTMSIMLMLYCIVNLTDHLKTRLTNSLKLRNPEVGDTCALDIAILSELEEFGPGACDIIASDTWGMNEVEIDLIDAEPFKGVVQRLVHRLPARPFCCDIERGPVNIFDRLTDFFLVAIGLRRVQVCEADVESLMDLVNHFLIVACCPLEDSPMYDLLSLAMTASRGISAYCAKRDPGNTRS